MGVVRLEALRHLQAQIIAAVPDLDGHVCVGQDPPNQPRKFPCLNIYPVRWKYFPDQEAEHLDPPDDRIVINVGRHEGIVQLRLAAATLNQRYELEQKVLDLFLSQEDRPGIVITPVSSIPELGTWIAAWELESDEWRDEKAFDRRFEAVMEVTGVIPALVNRPGVYRMNDIRLGLTHDFETAFTEATFDSSSKIERVQVNENGTVTAV